MKHVWNIISILGIWFITFWLDLLSFIVVPIALLFCGKNDHALPGWARWWETYDYGINGDPPWQGVEHANGREHTYWWRLRWLLRNRLGTFSYEVLGLPLIQVEYSAAGDVMTGNIPGHSGFLYAEAQVNAAHPDFYFAYPCYYFVRQWGSSEYCIRIYLGWKFRRADPVAKWPKVGRAPFVCSVNFLQHFQVGA